MKTVIVDGISYDVDVDILAGMYGGTQPKRRSQHVQGIKELKATGGNFAFEFPAQKISVEAERPDGATDVANVSVVAVVPYIIMKTAAMGRGKAKDAYDIYFRFFQCLPTGAVSLSSLHVTQRKIALQSFLTISTIEMTRTIFMRLLALSWKQTATLKLS